MKPHLLWLAVVAVLAATLTSAGCSRKEELTGTTSEPAPAADVVTFETPEAAVTALVTAFENRDRPGLQRLLGLASDDLLSSGDAVADSMARVTFLARYHAGHQLVGGSPDDVVLQVGEDNWPLPIPLLRHEGRWHWDGPAGMREIALRRIGANELRTIDVMRGFVVAQDEYAAGSHDGTPAGTYAAVFKSSPGKHDGLYWEVPPGEPESPAGPMLAAATTEGYSGQGRGSEPYHGYHYRMLSAQGPSAPGGAREYVVDGRQVGGFALVAWPASYGESGLMTFQVNHDGVVWQRDLGENTAQVASAMTRFDPDSTWAPIPEESPPSD
jgi:hypothetical protein